MEISPAECSTFFMLISFITNTHIFTFILYSNKTATAVPIFKPEDKIEKKNYRPVSISNYLSKTFGNVIKDQITPFLDNLLSLFVSAYRQSYSSQYALLRLIENWRQCLDHSKIFGIILMNLSKAFNCIPHDILSAKLNAYWVDISALMCIYSYLNGRKQTVRMNDIYSTYMSMLSGGPTRINFRTNPQCFRR